LPAADPERSRSEAATRARAKVRRYCAANRLTRIVEELEAALAQSSGLAASLPIEVTDEGRRDAAWVTAPEEGIPSRVQHDGGVLPVHLHTVRLFVHVLAATVWVGGQLTLAGLVPGLRSIAPDAPRIVARRFNRIAWPAYAVLIVTGLWNISAVHPSWSGRYGATLIVKIVVVALSGLSAWLHTVSTTKKGLAVWGALTGSSALAALFLGVMLHG
jgi:hypothetical protein